MPLQFLRLQLLVYHFQSEPDSPNSLFIPMKMIDIVASTVTINFDVIDPTSEMILDMMIVTACVSPG